MKSRKTVAIVSLVVVAFAAVLVWLLTPNPAQKTTQSETSMMPRPTSSMSTKEILASQQTLQNSVKALGWGYLNSPNVNQAKGIVTGYVNFEECPLLIEAGINREWAPVAILGDERLTLYLGGYQDLRERIYSNRQLIKELGWQNCWYEPAG